MTEFPTIFASTAWLRIERLMILARHDSGAINPATYQVIRGLEIEISWGEHRAGVVRRMGCEL